MTDSIQGTVPQAPIETLTEERCWELMVAKTVGRLAVSIANEPDIFPVNYEVDGESVVVRTAAGLKLAAATLGAAVAFEVDGLDEAAHAGWSVVIRGVATEVEGVEEEIEVEDLHLEPWIEGSKNRYFRITPTHVTGRRIPKQVTP
jgi:nitroimidazol reductase NimA-like FMN-containing flavoprotein (pyridoxamine 5'-phosphate oxidase superfamily)